jgi:hypothetical protein
MYSTSYVLYGLYMYEMVHSTTVRRTYPEPSDMYIVAQYTLYSIGTVCTCSFRSTRQRGTSPTNVNGAVGYV